MANYTNNIGFGVNLLPKESGNGTLGSISKIWDSIHVNNIHIHSTGDVSPTANGGFLIGETSGENISIDANEIMARNNGKTSPLYIQNEGNKIVYNSAKVISSMNKVELNGHLIINPSYNNNKGFNEGIRINRDSGGWATIYMGGSDQSDFNEGNGGFGIFTYYDGTNRRFTIASSSSTASVGSGIDLDQTGMSLHQRVGIGTGYPPTGYGLAVKDEIVNRRDGLTDWFFGNSCGGLGNNTFGFWENGVGLIGAFKAFSQDDQYASELVVGHWSGRGILRLGNSSGGASFYAYNNTSIRYATSYGTWNLSTVCNNASSDKRLKTNVKISTENALDFINNIKIYSFDRNDDKKYYKVGVIADELLKMDESLVMVDDMDQDEKNPIYKQVNVLTLTSYAIKGIQELSEKVEQLNEEQNQKLNEEINSLKEEIDYLKNVLKGALS